MKVNIKTISELTGFSQATISNVLNNKKGVNAKTAEQVMRVAKEIGYLSTKQIDTIKLVMYKKEGRVLTETPLISALLDGVESEGRAFGLDTVIYNMKEGESEFQAKFSQLSKECNSGIILLATELDWPDIQPFENVASPLVVVDAWFKEGHFDTVLMNNSDSLYLSVSYLAENGHKKIGYIGSTTPIRNFYYREMGFRQAMGFHNLPVEEKYFVKLDPTMNGSYEDMKAYLETKPELPTAYCVVNDIVAFGVMKALKEFNIKIPEDISIVGFDNMPFCEITSPSLTTIDIYKKEMGQIAVRHLIEQSKGDIHVPAKTQLLTRLIVRESVKKLDS